MPAAKAKEIIMLIGIPAAGKSTFYQQRFSATHLRINRDMLKTAIRTRSLFDWCLERGQSCVLDNTNTTREVRSPWIAAANQRNIPVIGYFFQSCVEGALERNSHRQGMARIRDAGVRDHHARLELPRIEEGFADLYFVQLADDGFEVHPWRNEI